MRLAPASSHQFCQGARIFVGLFQIDVGVFVVILHFVSFDFSFLCASKPKPTGYGFRTRDQLSGLHFRWIRNYWCSAVEMRIWCRNNRHKPLWWQYRILSSKLRGHFQYFGIRCNMRAMEAVLHYVIRGWKYWLSRRSHKSAISWEDFRKLLEKHPLPTPRIVHNV